MSFIFAIGTLIVGLKECRAQKNKTITPTPIKSTVFNITKDADLWYFNGVTPSNYKTTITLTAAGPTQGTFSWSVVSNNNAVVLENNSGGSITKQNDPTLKITSSGISITQNDVGISFTYNGNAVGTYKLTVFTPQEIKTVFLGVVRNISVTIPSSLSDPGGPGFESDATYQINDQFGAPIPSPLEINESFDLASLVNVVTNNWPQVGGVIFPTQSFVTENSPGPSLFSDVYIRAGGTYFPQPQYPIPPLSVSEVMNLNQRYFAGSLTSGSGRQFNFQALHWYLTNAVPIPAN